MNYRKPNGEICEHQTTVNGVCTLCDRDYERTHRAVPVLGSAGEYTVSTDDPFQKLRCLHCGDTYPRSVVHSCSVGPAAPWSTAVEDPEDPAVQASINKGTPKYIVTTSTGISAREYGCLAGQHEKDEQHHIRLNEIHVCRWCKALYWSGE